MVGNKPEKEYYPHSCCEFKSLCLLSPRPHKTAALRATHQNITFEGRPPWCRFQGSLKNSNDGGFHAVIVLFTYFKARTHSEFGIIRVALVECQQISYYSNTTDGFINLMMDVYIYTSHLH